MRRRRGGSITVLVAAVLSLGGGALISAVSDADAPSSGITATIGAPVDAPPVAAGFLGLSTEYPWAAQMAGPPGDQDHVLQRLIAQLAPGQSPIVRIGGDSADHSWVPTPGIPYADASAYAITRGWLASIHAFARALHARLILGLNMESDDRRLLDVEARELVGGIGRRFIRSLELGNEPNLYHSIRWYTAPDGRVVYGRRPGYGESAFLSDFSRFSQGLPAIPLAGPALGQTRWMGRVLRPLLRRSPKLRDVTFHRYPLNRCYTKPGTADYPTIANLLSPLASRGLAATVTPFVRIARGRHDSFRVDELNSVACRGQTGISDTFASALWALDTLFAMARVGVSGVNVQTFPYGDYRLFTLARTTGRWSGTVAPEYYGLLMFAAAAPRGSRLLRVRMHGPPAVRVWATSGGAPGSTTRVVLINDDTSAAHTITVKLPGAWGPAKLGRLLAPGVTAKSGVTLAGQSFGAMTTTGRLSGAPVVTAVAATGDVYSVRLPAASAALLAVAVRR